MIATEFLKPYGRALKYGALYSLAKRRAARVLNDETSASWPACAFFVGCGRSGTTIAGEILNRHPDVYYFFEPYHIWASIDPGIDVLNLYYSGPARFLLDAQHCTPQARQRFNRLILQPARKARAAIAIEKTPFNSLRIGYLDSLADSPRFIHFVRDGVDVARSIDRLSNDQTYHIYGKPRLNRWWGVSGCKWEALAEEGIAAGYFPGEVPLLNNYEAKGAYEWVVSLLEVDRWRDRLGNRLLEINYERLTQSPRETLEQMREFLGVSPNAQWFEKSVRMIDKPRKNSGKPIVLPPDLCAAFNRFQERFGFSGRAEPGVPTIRKCAVAMISNEPTPYRVHVLNRLSQELADVNMHNIFTHTLSTPSMPWKMEVAPRLKPVFFPRHHLTASRPVSWRSWPLFRDISRHCRDQRVEMIILLGYNDLTRLALVLWARWAGIPLIIAGDSNVFAEGRLSWARRVIKRNYIRWLLRRVAGLMPMGTCGRAYFRVYKDHDLPEFIFPYEPDYAALGRPSLPKLAEFKKKHQMQENRRRILICGRLVHHKRVDVLIDAFTRIAAARPDWDLVIAGDGPLRQQLVDRLPPAFRDRIYWMGFLQFDDAVLCYHSCHLLVHPSEFEPWGLVINEAVACNLLVISTSVVGAAVELVRHRVNGLIVPPRSVDALARAILEATEPARLNEMSRACSGVLASWRRAADPVQGVREALYHFAILSRIARPNATRLPWKEATLSDSIPGITRQLPGLVVQTHASADSRQ